MLERIKISIAKVRFAHLTVLSAVFVMANVLQVSPLQAQGVSDADILNFKTVEKSRGLPVRGTSQKKVLATYGEPTSRVGAVGKPPISRWNYSDFTVYFEHHLVITTVAKVDRLPTKLVGIQ